MKLRIYLIFFFWVVRESDFLPFSTLGGATRSTSLSRELVHHASSSVHSVREWFNRESLSIAGKWPVANYWKKRLLREEKQNSSDSLLCISVDFLFFETGPLLNSLSSLAANTGMNNSSLLLLFQSDHLSFRNRENPPLMIFVQIRIKHTFFTSIRNVIELKKL